MFNRIRQTLCVHWFDALTTREYSESFGAIVNCEQKTQTFTEESRTCSKCGLVDTRRVGEPSYEGWT